MGLVGAVLCGSRGYTGLYLGVVLLKVKGKNRQGRAYMFYRVYKFELKKYFKSVPVKIAVILNFILLVVFAGININASNHVRARDLLSVRNSYNQFNDLTVFLQARIRMANSFLESRAFLSRPQIWDVMSDEQIKLIIEYSEAARTMVTEMAKSKGSLFEYLSLGDLNSAFMEQRNFLALGLAITRFADDINAREVISPNVDSFSVLTGIHITTQGLFFENILASLDYLLDNNISPIYNSNDMTPFNFFYQVLFRLLPSYFLFIIALVCFKAIAGDIESNALIFSINKPASRMKLLLSKYAAAITASLVAVFVPIILTAMVLGFLRGFDSPRYPVLAQQQAYTSFGYLPNRLGEFERLFGNVMSGQDSIFSITFPFAMTDHIGISRFNIMGDGFAVNFQIDERLEFIPIHMFLIRTLPLWAAVAALFTGMAFFMGLIFRRRIVCFITGMAFAFGGALYSAPIRNLNALERLNPFLSLHAGSVISGLGSTTALNALLASFVPAVAVMYVCCILFKRFEFR